MDSQKSFVSNSPSVKSDPRYGRTSASTNETEHAERMRNGVPRDRRESIQAISAEVGISVGSVRNILHTKL
jgi:hypothetical protein